MGKATLAVLRDEIQTKIQEIERIFYSITVSDRSGISSDMPIRMSWTKEN